MHKPLSVVRAMSDAPARCVSSMLYGEAHRDGGSK